MKMKISINQLIDRILFFVAIAIVVTIVCFNVSVALGDTDTDTDTDLQLARARISIAKVSIVSSPGKAAEVNPWLPPKPPKLQPLPPETFTLPPHGHVNIIYAPFYCPPCEIQKKDLGGYKYATHSGEVSLTLTGTVEISYGGESLLPFRVPFYPFTTWNDKNGKWWYLRQWKGQDDLIERYRETERLANDPKAVANLEKMPERVNIPKPRSQQQFTQSTGSHWSHPGSIANHLRSDHGVDPSGMTHEQQLSYHDRLHESGVAGSPRRRHKH